MTKKYICIKPLKVPMNIGECSRCFQIGEIIEIYTSEKIPKWKRIYSINAPKNLLINVNDDISEWFITLSEYRKIKIDEILE